MLGRVSTRDNPERARIFIKTGNHISKPIKGKRTTVTRKGDMYSYSGKVVCVPRSYGENYQLGKRVIYISKAGQLIASPFDSDKKLATDEKSTLIYELVSNTIGAEGLRAMKGKQSVNVIFIAIACFVIGVGVVLGFTYFKEAYSISPEVTKTIPSAVPEVQTVPKGIDIQ